MYILKDEKIIKVRKGERVMNKYLVKGINEFDEKFEVEVMAESKEKCFFDIIDNDTVLEVESVTRVPMYNVGDRVIYLGLHKEEKIGVIEKVEEMDKYEWNKYKEDRFLYTLNNYAHIRNENEIVGFYNN